PPRGGAPPGRGGGGWEGGGRRGPAGTRVLPGDGRDLGRARAVLGPEIGRHAGAAEVDPEAGRLEGALEQPGALELLHPGLAVEEDRVADRGHLLHVAVDRLEGELLALVGPGGERHERAGKPHAADQDGEYSAGRKSAC